MKALEKAAQDRDKTPAMPPQPVSSAGRELTLEAVEPVEPAALKTGIKADENTTRVAISPKRAASAPVSPPLQASPALAQGKPSSGETARASVTAPSASPSLTQARAASVINAGTTSSRGTSTLAWLMARPVYLFGGFAALFLLVYGAYVYIQIAHPGLLVKSPPPPPSVSKAPTPVAASPEPLATGAQQDPAQPGLVTMQSVFSGRTDNATPSTPSLPTVPPPAASASMEMSGSVPPQAARTTASPAAATSPATPPATPPLALPARVAVSRGDNAVPRINPGVSDAYAALEARNFDAAQRLYAQVLRTEPNNIDALLGLASIAQYENRPEVAQRYFMAILDVEPRNTLAQSGLISLISRADPQAAESRLKQLLAREPTAPLHFNLGNVYAEQGQWPQAQQAYFQAHVLEPRNPDYAYNLAVGLEHLGQQKIALDFYRKALQLASDKGNANFDAARLQERIAQLARLN